ncbi:hypothetical protein SEA_MAGRITTE_160 [Microbacterium phage Magritte]|nr:hypothetical protein SEA_MAGRITTE_160 [Microbacterium phage Magritte]
MYDTTPAAELFVARVADLITPAEATRMRASLEIDLHMGAAHAVDRAMRSLERQRLGYRSSMSRREIEALEEIGRVIRKAPVEAPAPIPASRDWNDEAARTVATYAADTVEGYGLNVEPVDSATYRPYFRTVVAA